MALTPNGEYFMTSEAEEAAKWRVVKDHQDTKARLAALRAEATKIGDFMRAIGQALRDDPAQINVEQSGSLSMLQQLRSLTMPLETINGERVKALVMDIHDTQEKLKQLAEQVQTLGLTL
jgi:hypothetical protein